MASMCSRAKFGGAIGSNIFLADEAPRYWTGYGLCLGFLTIAIISCLFLRSVLQRINVRRDRYTAEAEVREQYSEGESASPLPWEWQLIVLRSATRLGGRFAAVPIRLLKRL